MGVVYDGTLLDENLDAYLKALKAIEPNVDDVEKAANAAKTIHEMKLAEIESANRMELEKEKAELEKERLEVDKTKLEVEKKSGKRRILVDIGKGLLLAGVSVWGTLYTTGFEKTDSYTSTAGKSFSRSITDLFKKSDK